MRRCNTSPRVCTSPVGSRTRRKSWCASGGGARVSRYYAIRLEKDAASGRATALHWERSVPTEDTLPGVYCLRNQLDGEARVTVVLHREDGKVCRIRKATRPERHQLLHYNALGMPHLPGKTEKTLINPSAQLAQM